MQWAGQRVALLTGYSGRPRGHGREDGFASGVEGRTHRAVGALMAVSAPAIERAGLLDEDLFAYVEDVDWSLRIRAAGLEYLRPVGSRRPPRLGLDRRRGLDAHRLLRHAQHDRRLRAPPAARGGRVRRCGGRHRAAFLAHAGVVLRSREAVAAVREGYRDALAGRLGRASALVPPPPAAPHVRAEVDHERQADQEPLQPSTSPESHIQT